MTMAMPIDNLSGRVSFSQGDWDQTPHAVQVHLAAQDAELHTVKNQLQQLQQLLEAQELLLLFLILR